MAKRLECLREEEVERGRGCNDEINRALFSGDPEKYYRAISEAEEEGCSPPIDFPEIYEEGKGLASLNDGFDVREYLGKNGGDKGRGHRRRGSKFDYGRFEMEIKEYSERYGLNLSPFEDTEIKRKILEKCGYESLKSRGGMTSIKYAKPGRIGIVFLRVYEEFERRKGGVKNDRRKI